MNKMYMAALAGIAAIAACSDSVVLSGVTSPYMGDHDPPIRDTSPKFYDRPNPNAMPKNSGKARKFKTRKRRA